MKLCFRSVMPLSESHANFVPTASTSRWKWLRTHRSSDWTDEKRQRLFCETLENPFFTFPKRWKTGCCRRVTCESKNLTARWTGLGKIKKDKPNQNFKSGQTWKSASRFSKEPSIFCLFQNLFAQWNSAGFESCLAFLQVFFACIHLKPWSFSIFIRCNDTLDLTVP